MTVAQTPSVPTSRTITELRRLAEQTANDEGAQRLAFTPTWASARKFLVERLAALPIEVEVDEAGNLWATLRGERPDALLIGGHLDSVPGGGWLDGSLNILAGLDVLRRLAGSGLPPITVRLVDWADEEGARFGGVSMFGSGVATHAIDPVTMADLRDSEGITFAEAVAPFGVDLTLASQAGRQLDGARAYVELHIEQGPVLEHLGLPLAVVTGTLGVERHRVRFAGQRAHAGATPMDARRDALLAAARFIIAVHELATEANGFGTVGRIRARPDTPTVVASDCDVSVDLRQEDQRTLGLLLERCRAASMAIGREENVTVHWEGIWSAPVTSFDSDLIELGRQAIQSVGCKPHQMASATLHDASRVAQAGIPTAMLFVQSLQGLSHCREEDTRPEHIDLAVAALNRVVDLTVEWLT